jgi:hypothetical protein
MFFVDKKGFTAYLRDIVFSGNENGKLRPCDLNMFEEADRRLTKGEKVYLIVEGDAISYLQIDKDGNTQEYPYKD